MSDEFEDELDPSMYLPEGVALLEEQKRLSKVDNNIPPMPEEVMLIPVEGSKFGEMIIDPLCPQARWRCKYEHLPKIYDIYTDSKISRIVKKSAFNKALVLIAEHQIAPPSWLAKAMLTEFFEKSKTKNIPRKPNTRKTEHITPEIAMETIKLFEKTKAEKIQNHIETKAALKQARKDNDPVLAEKLRDKLDNRVDNEFDVSRVAICKAMQISEKKLKKHISLLKRMRESEEKILDSLP